MKQVFEHIAQCSRNYEKQPIFTYLSDQSLAPQERLAFVPSLSHFVMTFADLYNSFLTVEPATDRYEELVNTHLREESAHWRWFLVDLETMGLNPMLSFTDTLKALWGPETLKTRVLAYEICKLSANLSSLERLVLVHAIEATGRVALEALVPVGVQCSSKSTRKLVYFGSHHLDTERAHTVEGDETKGFLEQVALSNDQLENLYRLVDQVFEHFEAFAQDAFKQASAGLPFYATARSQMRADEAM